eukprot:5751263-Pyramimonas_sp.AAC.1
MHRNCETYKKYESAQHIIPMRPYLGVGASRKATLVGAVNALLLLLLTVVVVAVAVVVAVVA